MEILATSYIGLVFLHSGLGLISKDGRRDHVSCFRRSSCSETNVTPKNHAIGSPSLVCETRSMLNVITLLCINSTMYSMFILSSNTILGVDRRHAFPMFHL